MRAGQPQSKASSAASGQNFVAAFSLAPSSSPTPFLRIFHDLFTFAKVSAIGRPSHHDDDHDELVVDQGTAGADRDRPLTLLRASTSPPRLPAMLRSSPTAYAAQMSSLKPTNIDELSVATIRCLAADVVAKANSGHPGMPMGEYPESPVPLLRSSAATTRPSRLQSRETGADLSSINRHGTHLAGPLLQVSPQ